MAYSLDDTIVALATPPASSAIAVVRLSGAGAITLASQIFPALPQPPEAQHAYLCGFQLDDGQAKISDKAVVTCWIAPASYTGEDLVECSLHGNPVLLNRFNERCIRLGARAAQPGEFTFRAYMLGKLDLVQAEAVQELISAGSEKALALAAASLGGTVSAQAQKWVDSLGVLLAEIEVIHDYASDDLDASLDSAALLTPTKLAAKLAEYIQELQAALETSKATEPLREGVSVAICGEPNVGKSTLFNALLGHDRALTAPTPGTTRDYLTESIHSGGIKLTLVDTAGYRTAQDAVEAAGVEKAGDWAKSADIVLWVMDVCAEEASPPALLQKVEPLVVKTKCDLLETWPAGQDACIHISGITGQGLAKLRQAIEARLSNIGGSALASFSKRQAGQVQQALTALTQASSALEDAMPLDAVATDLYIAKSALHGIYQHEDKASVINQIFSGFCVGK